MFLYTVSIHPFLHLSIELLYYPNSLFKLTIQNIKLTDYLSN